MVRTDFVANVSHELKTPLSSIIGYLETLLTVDDEKNKKKFISIIQDQSNRMNSLIDDLLSLSSIENKKTNENDQFCNLLNTVKIGINSLESKILKKKINVDINLDQSLLVGCPHEEFIQVVVNIVNNAVKYSKDGAKILIKAREKMNTSNMTEYVEISFKDNGIGIAEEHISRLTERFYRVDSARSKEVGGTGLGLSIVKHILNKNMGFIDIKSEVGKGSEFLITIPKHA
jgi:two-component system phosphate regulon sensor histidine kinase PhoR